MNHLPIVPILLPSLAGTLMLLPPLSKRLWLQRWITGFGLLALVVVAGALMVLAQQQIRIYALGGWQPPFGIVLVVDRMTALLLMTTAILASCAGLYSAENEDRQGPFFYSLFWFQIMGINGAFLTGDLFNLFVFFEVLLISSYALLIHGGGKEKTKAGFQYVSLNLIGSALFLVALGTLYGTVGSLNMADLAAKVRFLTPEEQILAKVGGLLLLLVFSLKAALLPLHFWLPKAYGAASASVAALFAILTKVGFYAICRVFSGIFGDNGGDLAHFAAPWIWPLAIATIAVGSVGIYAAASLRMATANVVIVSAGTLLLTLVVNDGQSLPIGLFYLLHSTAVTGALFLVADQMGTQRGAAPNQHVGTAPEKRSALLGWLFLTASVAAVGLPPLSGFVGKALLLQSTTRFIEQVWVWPALLISSFASLVAFSRAGTAYFWNATPSPSPPVGGDKLRLTQIVAISILLASTALMAVYADRILTYSQGAAEDLRRHPLTDSANLTEERSGLNAAHES